MPSSNRVFVDNLSELLNEATPPGDNTTGRVKVTDGAEVVDVLDQGNNNGLAVVILDGSGDPITSFGGGTQYEEGATDASITGTAMLGEGGSDTLYVVQVDDSGNLKIVGSITHGAADSGNPVKVGGYADSGVPTPVDIADRANVWTGLSGQQVIGGRDVTPGDAATNIAAGLPALSNGTARHLQVMPAMFNGSTWDRLKGDATDGLLVNLGGNNDVSLNAGTNAIGKLTANSGVDIGDVDVTSIAAGTNVIGRVAAIAATGAIYNGTTSTTPVFASVDVASSGDNTLVAAQGASNKIRVYSCVLVASAAVTVRFESGAGGTALTGQMQLAANSGFVLPFNPLGWFETAGNALLNLELSGAISVDGCLTYSVVT